MSIQGTYTIQLRRDTAADWTSHNPTLAAGEIGFETDTTKIKIGNGTSTWTSLSYWSEGGGSMSSESNYVQIYREYSTLAPISDSPLAANAVQNGKTWTLSDGLTGLGTSRFRAFAASDQAGTLAIQQSPDGANWFDTTSEPVAAGFANGTIVESILTLGYVRASYTNGSTVQTEFEFDTTVVAI